MLEQLRRNSRSFIIWILFGIIIAAFILTFGSQGGLQFDCSGGATTNVMEVADEEVSVHSWRFGINTMSRAENRAQTVLDQLVAREILAQAAAEAGFRVTTDQVNEHIKRGRFWLFGSKFEPGSMQQHPFIDAQGVFDYRSLMIWVQNLGMPTVDHFITEQQREIMADMMRGLIMQSAEVSLDEARARFVHENTTATIDVVEFRPSEYRRKLVLTPAQIDAYVSAREDEVRKRYEADERLYKERSEEVRVRQLMFKRVNLAPAEGEPGAVDEHGHAPHESSEASAAAPATPDPGLVAARAAHAKLEAGADFAALAAELGEDERTRARGGDLGWKSAKAPGLGAKQLADALATLEVGAFSDVIETPAGFHILKIEDKRQGDLSFDQVKHEIGERLALEHYGRELARQAAEAALAEAKAGKTPGELFERDTAPRFDINQLPPELLQQLTPEQIQQLLQRSGEQGSLRIETPEVPASSSTGTGDQAPAAGDQAAATGEQAAAAAGAADAPAGDSNDAASLPPAPAIPMPEGVAKPKVRSIGPLQRDLEGRLPPLGASEELTRAIFDELAPGQVAPQVHEVDGVFVIAWLTERKTPDFSKFDAEEQAERMRGLRSERGYVTLQSWLLGRCRALAEAGEIRLNQNLLTQLSDDPDRPLQYAPCATLK